MANYESRMYEYGDPYENLAKAIIEVAAKDLRKSLESGKVNDDRDLNPDSIRRFFRSEWFVMLSGVDGDKVCRLIERDVDERKGVSRTARRGK